MYIKNLMNNRKSERKYLDKDVDDKIIMECLSLARKSATSINGQQISMIVVKDKEKIRKIADVNWGQPHIYTANFLVLFVADFNRPEAVMYEEMVIHNDIESVIVGSVDAGIISQSAELIFKSQGIGGCYLGGVRHKMKEVCEILGITGKAFPVIAMSFGYCDMEDGLDLRPRIEHETAIMFESYDEEKVRKGSIEYIDSLNKWWESKNMSTHRSYADSMTDFYKKYYIPEELEQLQSLGFLSKYKNK